MTWDTRHDRTTPISLAWDTARRSRPIVFPKRIWCLRTFAVASAIEHFDTMRKCKDGRLVPISLTVSPIRTLGNHRWRVEDGAEHFLSAADRRRARRTAAAADGSRGGVRVHSGISR